VNHALVRDETKPLHLRAWYAAFPYSLVGYERIPQDKRNLPEDQLPANVKLLLQGRKFLEAGTIALTSGEQLEIIEVLARILDHKNKDRFLKVINDFELRSIGAGAKLSEDFEDAESIQSAEEKEILAELHQGITFAASTPLTAIALLICLSRLSSLEQARHAIEILLGSFGLSVLENEELHKAISLDFFNTQKLFEMLFDESEMGFGFAFLVTAASTPEIIQRLQLVNSKAEENRVSLNQLSSATVWAWLGMEPRVGKETEEEFNARIDRFFTVHDEVVSYKQELHKNTISNENALLTMGLIDMAPEALDSYWELIYALSGDSDRASMYFAISAQEISAGGDTWQWAEKQIQSNFVVNSTSIIGAISNEHTVAESVHDSHMQRNLVIPQTLKFLRQIHHAAAQAELESRMQEILNSSLDDYTKTELLEFITHKANNEQWLLKLSDLKHWFLSGQALPADLNARLDGLLDSHYLNRLSNTEMYTLVAWIFHSLSDVSDKAEFLASVLEQYSDQIPDTFRFHSLRTMHRVFAAIFNTAQGDYSSLKAKSEQLIQCRELMRTNSEDVDHLAKIDKEFEEAEPALAMYQTSEPEFFAALVTWLDAKPQRYLYLNLYLEIKAKRDNDSDQELWKLFEAIDFAIEQNAQKEDNKLNIEAEKNVWIRYVENLHVALALVPELMIQIIKADMRTAKGYELLGESLNLLKEVTVALKDKTLVTKIYGNNGGIKPSELWHFIKKIYNKSGNSWSIEIVATALNVGVIDAAIKFIRSFDGLVLPEVYKLYIELAIANQVPDAAAKVGVTGIGEKGRQQLRAIILKLKNELILGKGKWQADNSIHLELIQSVCRADVARFKVNDLGRLIERVNKESRELPSWAEPTVIYVDLAGGNTEGKKYTISDKAEKVISQLGEALEWYADKAMKAFNYVTTVQQLVTDFEKTVELHLAKDPNIALPERITLLDSLKALKVSQLGIKGTLLQLMQLPPHITKLSAYADILRKLAVTELLRKDDTLEISALQILAELGLGHRKASLPLLSELFGHRLLQEEQERVFGEIDANTKEFLKRQIFEVEMLDQEIELVAQSEKYEANGEKLELLIIPDLGVMGEMVGQVADMCLAGSTIYNLEQKDTLPLIFAVGLSQEMIKGFKGYQIDPEFVVKRGQNLSLEGGAVLVFSKDEAGNKIMHMTGNNPLQTFLRKVIPQDLVEKQYELLQSWASKLGMRIVVPMDKVQQTSTNRLEIYTIYQKLFSGNPKVQLRNQVIFDRKDVAEVEYVAVNKNTSSLD
jgi:hypothetical protein